MRRRVSFPILLLTCALVGTVAYLAFCLYGLVKEQALDCYAQWWVADMVIDHMQRNDGAWPSSWEDLRESYEVFAGRFGQLQSFEDLQRRCAIDFEADPQQLATVKKGGEGPPFRVIWLRNGKGMCWSGHEPNQMILDYLLERAARPDSYPSKKHLVPEERQARSALLEIGARWEIDEEGRITTVRLTGSPGHPRFNDDALRHLSTLRNLRGLDLGYSDVTNAGLSRIQSLSELRWLNLYGTRVTDDGLQYLQGLSNLEALALADDEFTDRCLEYTTTLPNLRILNLNGCRITDDGVKWLCQHKNLEHLFLYNTEVTSEGIRELHRALPQCKIER
jgi:hypothetical protein